jgi:branched-chain amino acid transport system permease protein
VSTVPESAGSDRPNLRSLLAAAGAWWRRRDTTLIGLAMTLVLLLVLPQALGVSVFGYSLGWLLSVHLLVVTLIYALAAQGWNLAAGLTGQFSFGHAAFFGLGAYAPLVLAREYAISPWIGMLVGGLLAGGYAVCIGVLSYRYNVEGSYFALITLAFSELLLYVFINVEWLGGASGFVKPLPGVYDAEFGLAAFQFRETLPYYYVVLAVLVVTTLVVVGIKRSRVGLYLAAIRDDEDGAAAVGIPTTRYKLFSLAVSAFVTALAGSCWAMYFISIRPRVVFDIFANLNILLPAVVGGLGTGLGPILGSFVLTVVGETARQFVDLPELQRIVYGLLLLVVVLRAPGGVVSLPKRIVDRFAELRDRSRSDTDDVSNDRL